jgi:hypothetical protein
MLPHKSTYSHTKRADRAAYVECQHGYTIGWHEWLGCRRSLWRLGRQRCAVFMVERRLGRRQC